MKRIISTLLSVLLVFVSLNFVACGKDSNSDKTNGNADMVLLNGFEDFERDVQLIHLLNRFGSVDMNRDAKYIKSGSGSLILRPLGYGFNNINPAIMIKTYSTRFNFGYTDFTEVDAISLAVYNAEDKTLKMGIGLAMDNGTVSSYRLEAMGQTTPEWFELKPGWNDVVMGFDSTYLKLQRDISVDKIYGIVFRFESANSFNSEDAPTLYFDDLYIHYGKTQSESITLKSDAANGYYEVADFENPGQGCFFSATAPVLEFPELSIVSGPEEGIAPKSGIMVLKLVKKPSFGQGGYPYLYMADEIFQQAVKSVGQDLIDNPYDYAFKFDVYSASDVTETIAVDFSAKTETGQRWAATNSTVKVAPGTWSEYSITFGAIDDANQSSLKRSTIKSIQNTLNSEREAGKNVNLTEEEKAQMMQSLGWTDEDLQKGLSADYPKQGGVFTAEQTSDYIFKYYLYDLSYDEARELLLKKEVMLTSDFETMYKDKETSVVKNPYGMRMLLDKYNATETKADRVLYFDNFRIEKIKTEASV